MVYNSVKYVQIGKKNGHVMVFLLVPISSLWKYPQPRSFMALLIFGDCLDRVKGICWDCKWFSISSTATGHTETSNKSGAMNRNPDVLVKVAPKAEGLQGWQVRLQSGCWLLCGWLSRAELERMHEDIIMCMFYSGFGAFLRKLLAFPSGLLICDWKLSLICTPGFCLSHAIMW